MRTSHLTSRVAKSLAALGLGFALVLLGGCSDTKTASPSATPSTSPSVSASPTESTVKVTPSTNLDAISVKGDYGKAPKVTFKDPWGVDKTRTKVLKASNGAVVQSGKTVELNYVGINARTGKTFDDSFSKGKPVAFNLDQVVPGFKKGLLGQKAGSRILVAIAGPDGYDSQGGNPQIDVKVGDTLLFVIDVVDLELSGPQGAAVAPKPGLPVVTDKGGKPSIAVPKTAPPTTLQIETLIKGTGKKVTEADAVTVNYRWVAWKDGRLLEDTYSGKPATAELATLLQGVQKGLVGQTVGSRVLLVIPPADGYPQGNTTPKIDPGETLVFVVDLLFTQSP